MKAYFLNNGFLVKCFCYYITVVIDLLQFVCLSVAWEGFFIKFVVILFVIYPLFVIES